MENKVPKIVTTLRLPADTQTKLRGICQMIMPHPKMGDVIEWLVNEKYDELTKQAARVEELAAVAPENGNGRHPGPTGGE